MTHTNIQTKRFIKNQRGKTLTTTVALAATNSFYVCINFQKLTICFEICRKRRKTEGTKQFEMIACSPYYCLRETVLQRMK